MKPVNLIPGSENSRVKRDSKNLPYILLATVGVLTIFVASFFYFSGKVSGKKDQLSSLKQELSTLQSQAADSGSSNNALAQARLASLQSLDKLRFDWPAVLAEVSQAMPANAWLIETTGKLHKEASTGESGQASGNSGGEQPPDVAGPSLQLIGCSYKQSDVARMISRLRSVSGVERVLITSSNEKDDADSASSSATAATTTNENECRTKLGIHKFNVTLAFNPGETPTLIEQISSQLESSSAPATTASSGGASTTPPQQAPGGAK